MPRFGGAVRASAGAGGGGTTSAGVYNVADYGAKGDGKMARNGAITAGTTTLTVTDATFTAADVGKRVIVVRAGATGGPLSTTITAVTGATTVTLAAAAGTTTTAQDVTWGTDDTAALQAALNATTAANGTLQLGGGRYLFTHLNITGSCTVAGIGAHALFETWGNGLGNFTPLRAPFLAGTVLVCITNGQPAAIDIPTEAVQVNLRDFGLQWASPFVSTGHGIRAVAGSAKNGMTNSRWSSVFCWGHDGNSYAWYLQNATKSQFEHIRSYGGGMLYYEQNGGSQYGNNNFLDMEGKLLARGTAHCTHLNNPLGDWTRTAFIGCEFNVVDGQAYGPLTRYAFLTPASPQSVFKADTADKLRGLTMISPAFDTVGVTVDAPTFPAAYSSGGVFLDPGGWWKHTLSNFFPMAEVPPTAFSTNAVQPMLLTTPVTRTAALTLLVRTMSGLQLCNATTAAFTMTLPPANLTKGRTFTFKKTDVSANAVTVAAAGTDRIDGAATYVLATQYAFVTVVSDGTNWQRI